ncbi:MAG: hypothetical protein ACXWFI_02870 [Methylobacter sp.]
MNDAIQAALAPLAAFWIALDGITKMTQFVNGMREVIIMGVKDEIVLSLNHRKAMFYDWKLTMIGFIGATFMFSGVVFSLADLATQAAIGIYAVSVGICLGAVLFVLCGISDYRAISLALKETHSEGMFTQQNHAPDAPKARASDG